MPVPGPPWQQSPSAPKSRALQKRSVQAGFPERFDSYPVRIMAVGDILLGSDWPKPDLPERNPLRHAGPLLRKADLTFGNLEGPICAGGEVHPAKRNSAHSFAFRMPLGCADWLQEAGFDALSVANNHAGDFQELGRKSTVDALQFRRIEPVGSPDKPYGRQVPNGTPVVMLGFATNRINPNVNDIAAAEAMVRKAVRKAGGGFVLVSFHAGAEGIAAGRIPQGKERFHGEDRGDVRKFARAMVDAGASLVLGHGPHVLRGMEFRRGRLIAYSLGNFATWSKMSLKGSLGNTVVLDCSLDPTGRFLSGRVHPFRQVGQGEPKPDPKRTAVKEMIERTKLDFPKTGAQFKPDGTFTY